MNLRSLSLIVLCHGLVAVMYGFTLWGAIAKS